MLRVRASPTVFFTFDSGISSTLHLRVRALTIGDLTTFTIGPSCSRRSASGGHPAERPQPAPRRVLSSAGRGQLHPDSRDHERDRGRRHASGSAQRSGGRTYYGARRCRTSPRARRWHRSYCPVDLDRHRPLDVFLDRFRAGLANSLRDVTPRGPRGFQPHAQSRVHQCRICDVTNWSRGAAVPPIIATRAEIRDLIRVVRRNCQCRPRRLAGPAGACSVCLLLWDEQTALRLIFYRRYVAALMRGELMQPPDWRA